MAKSRRWSKSSWCLCVCVTGVQETTNVSSRGKPPPSQSSPPDPTPRYQNNCPVLTSHPYVSDRVILHRSQTSCTFVLFCSFFFCLDSFFVFFLLFCSFFSCCCCCCCCVCGCLGVGCVCVCVCVCARVRVCVFSPASSVDYGSFADRCSTWLELLRLKAHTIRRGSVKTSRRTQSLAHSGDQTHKYRTQSHKQSRTHTHMLDTLTHPSMHAAGGRSIVNQAPAFLAGVWKLKPRPSEGSTISSLALRCL